MKIRKGFVSNSSSSSFIVHYDRNNKTIGENEMSDVTCGIGILFSVEKGCYFEDEHFHYNYDHGYKMCAVRGILQMKDEQTLKEFKEETIELFKSKHPEIKEIEGPFIMMNGSLGW